jgi:hypothetical protein
MRPRSRRQHSGGPLPIVGVQQPHSLSEPLLPQPDPGDLPRRRPGDRQRVHAAYPRPAARLVQQPGRASRHGAGDGAPRRRHASAGGRSVFGRPPRRIMPRPPPRGKQKPKNTAPAPAASRQHGGRHALQGRMGRAAQREFARQTFAVELEGGGCVEGGGGPWPPWPWDARVARRPARARAWGDAALPSRRANPRPRGPVSAESRPTVSGDGQALRPLLTARRGTAWRRWRRGRCRSGCSPPPRGRAG